MTAQPSPTPEPSACPLCSAPIAAGDARCPDCGYTLAGVAGHGPAFSRAVLLWTIAAFLAVYLITIAIVAAIR